MVLHSSLTILPRTRSIESLMPRECASFEQGFFLSDICQSNPVPGSKDHVKSQY